MTPTEAQTLVARLRGQDAIPNLNELADAIEALARALAEARKVKPLEWEDRPPRAYRATGIGETYTIHVHMDGKAALQTREMGEWAVFEGLTAAKAAAEADHRARVLAQLEGQA